MLEVVFKGDSQRWISHYSSLGCVILMDRSH